MAESNEGQTVEQNSLTTNEKVRAVLGTLKKNKAIHIDGVLAAVSFGIPALLGEPSIGAMLVPFSTMARPAIEQTLNHTINRNNSSMTDEENNPKSILGDIVKSIKVEAPVNDGTSPFFEEKHMLEYLVKSWKSGETQIPKIDNGRVDPNKVYDLIHSSKS